MLGLLPWAPALPLLGAVLLAAGHKLWPERIAGLIGAGSIGLSALCAVLASQAFLASGQPDHVVHLWTWFDVGGLAPGVAFHLDGLTVTMLGVITGVGFLIHVFAAGYMHGEPSYCRFFAYMNLFVAAMLVLVLADNLVLLYLGWEGVGLCSYLLIGFWYRDTANGNAARKAFIVTRVGDTLMAIGLLLLFRELGTLDIHTINDRAPFAWADGGGIVTAICLLLLGGAAGKSAQVPLHTWLPDAMAGPTPVSALIHAATMVTAGVYLIARLHPVFLSSPLAMHVVAIVGLVTLLVAGLSALGQNDIKRILAYSTISQIGYMVLALGVGAFTAAIGHLMTHAFFKALLFLAAGAVIHHVKDRQDIFAMGGLKDEMPITFTTFAIGAAALAALPVVTAGFWSKDAILLSAFYHQPWLWAGGLLGALVTSLYIGRCVFIAFFGTPRADDHTPHHEHLNIGMKTVLIALAILSVVGALIPQPLAGVLPAAEPHHGWGAIGLMALSGAIAIAGLGLAWLWFGPGRATPRVFGPGRVMAALHSGLGFDWLYARLLLRPYLWLARLSKPDWVDRIVDGLAATARGGHLLASASQTGNLRWYLGATAGGLLVIVLVALA